MPTHKTKTNDLGSKYSKDNTDVLNRVLPLQMVSELGGAWSLQLLSRFVSAIGTTRGTRRPENGFCLHEIGTTFKRFTSFARQETES